MPEHLNARVEACYRQAEHFFQRSFPRPTVSFRLRGQKAGVAHLDENLLRFNPQLYRENREHFLEQTVAHEVAHLIAHQLFGPRIRPHGEEWQLIMRGIYGLPPDRGQAPRHHPLPVPLPLPGAQRLPVLPATPHPGGQGAPLLLPALQGDPGVHRRSAPRVIQAMAPAAFSSAIRSAE